MNQRLPTAPHYRYAENLEDPNVRGNDAIRRLFLIEIAKVAHEVAAEVPEEAVTNHGT